MSTENKRRGELEVMGMLVVFGLVFFHTAQIFYGGDFLVMNEPSSILALVFVAFASLWAMPLMFFISGITIWYSLRKRTTVGFIRNRIRRLFIPFVAGLILVVPPQVYYGLKVDPAYHESYLQFYPRFFDVQFALEFPLFIKGVPPDEFFRLSTLYFLIDLFVFTLLLLPIFLHLQTPRGKQLVERWANLFARPGAIFALALPIGVTEAILGSDFPGSWNPFAWLPLIFYGFLFTCDKRFGSVLQKQRKFSLIMGIITFPLWFFGIGMLSTIFQVDPSTDYSLLSVLVRFLKGFGGWFWVVAIMGLATRLPRSKSIRTRNGETSLKILIHESEDTHKPVFKDRIVAYTKEAQLPFYILHHLPVVIIGFYVVQWEVGALVKYIVISLSSLIVTLVLFDVGVRRTKLTRFIFGMKEKTNQKLAGPRIS